jgi:hypothetical protein
MLLPAMTFAQDYKIYTKVGLGYAISQPSDYKDSYLGDKVVTQVYGNDNTYYFIEQGLRTGNYQFGIYWSDLVNQTEYKDVHRPYKLEVFADHFWKYKSYSLKIGTGIKLFEDRRIEYNYNNIDYSYDYHDGYSFDKRLSARISIYKRYKNYVLGLEHHSQWFVGYPFNNSWEPHRTEISLSYMFD